MKVLLVNPPVPDRKKWIREGRCQQWDLWGAPFPPLSLALIAGQIRDISETLVIDSGPAGLDLRQTVEKAKLFSPDLIFLCTATPTVSSDLGWFLPALKKIKQGLKAAAIGIHVSELPQETMTEFKELDFVIRGEPEMTAKKLTEYLHAGRTDFGNIPNMVFRKGEEIIINESGPLTEDLDSLASPDWTGVEFRNYRLPIFNTPFNLISVARGCPCNCGFCPASSYYGKKLRKRSPEKIAEEIELNIREFGIRDFLFWAEFLPADGEYLISVIRILDQRGLIGKIRWMISSRIDGIDAGLFGRLKEAGCWQIAFGLEFGDNRILQAAEKGEKVTIERARKTVSAAHKAGIACTGHFILGYPGETEESVRKTIDFSLSLPLTFANFYAATPFPGSELYREACRNKWVDRKDWRNIDQTVPLIPLEDLNRTAIGKYLREANMRFYLRPVTLRRIWRMAGTPGQLLNLIYSGTKFLFRIG